MPAALPASLNQQFGIPGVAEIVEAQGGLLKVVVRSSAAEGEMYLHGAHVAAWKPVDSREVLFMSRNSLFQDGKPIRGGVPVCFPWFGPKPADPKAPAHGFARIRSWQLKSVEQIDGSVAVSMELSNDAETTKWWPADFRLLHRATFGRQLTLEFMLTNTGTTSVFFEEALHTYYRIGDVSKISIQGLDTIHYLDKTDGNEEKIQRGPITISGETDRVYFNTTGDVEIVDPVLRRRITVRKQNSLSTVVWNPWMEKAKAMADLGETAWPSMVCVEVCNVGPFAVEVAPGQTHSMQAITSVSAY